MLAAIGGPEFLILAWSLLWGAVGLGIAVVVVMCVWRATKALERIAMSLDALARPKV